MCIISQRNKYVFIHIPKNAGGSIRQYLTQNGNGRKPNGIYQHVGIEHVLDMFTMTKRYFSFAVVRNPWERMWSFYKFGLQRGINIHQTFEEFLLEDTIHNWAKTFRRPDTPVQKRQQIDWITDEPGHVIVDYVIRYEDLKKDFKDVCKCINVILPNNLQRIHKTTNTIPYTDVYTDNSRDFIAEHFADDIKEFGYKFDE